MSLKVISFMIGLINMTVYSTIILAIIMIFRRIMGTKLPGSGRSVIWAFGILSLIIPTVPIYSKISNPGFTFGFEILRHEIIVNNTLQMSPVSIVFNSSVFPISITVPFLSIFYIWLIVAAMILLYNLYIYISFYLSLIKIPVSEDSNVLNMVRSNKAYMKIPQNIAVVFIKKTRDLKQIKFPSVYGIIKSYIIIPEEQWVSLNDDEKNTIIIHELLHVKHKDNYKNILFLLIQAFYWFNPLVWKALKQLRLDLEINRDREVIKQISANEIKSYANSLFRIAGSCSGKYSILPYCGILCMNGLKLRLQLIERRMQRSHIIPAFILTITVLLMITYIYYRLRFNITYILDPMLH